jgi:NAD(P)-dependent dehydrogenase (short-subunit alcohol dehydrogenase family)
MKWPGAAMRERREMSNPKLQGRAVLVLGGASGIGRACAEACIDDGAAVMVADLNETLGKEVVATLRGRGGSASFVPASVLQEQEVRHAVEETVRAFGKLDGLVTSVGRLPTGDGRWHANIELYLKGPYYACKHAIEAMQRAGGGSIVNIASIAGVTGGGGAEHIDDSGYASAKHGVVGMTRTIALAYARKNIRANAICPGYVRTALTERFHAVGDGGEALINDKLRVPMGRWGEPHEIGKVAAFLLSDDASFITGQPIVVDGGFMAR